MGTVYLLHFDEPVGNLQNPRGQARHYIGWTDRDVEDRINDHVNGCGSPLVACATGVQLVRRWRGGRNLERRLKNHKNSPRLCPVCNPGSWRSHACYSQ